ncbi:MAG: hypothetical protein WA160_10545 [Pseudobdellovibrio sp.]
MKVVSMIFVLFLSQFALAQPLKTIADLLNQRTLGLDSFYGTILSPSESLETEKQKTERIQSENLKMLSEIDLISEAFDKSASSTVVDTVYEAVRKIDANVIGSNGNIIFQGTSPSSAQSRSLYLIPKAKTNSSSVPQSLLNALTSYKRSAKPSDFVYDYSQPLSLPLGPVKETVGTETSWFGAEAAQPFHDAQEYTLKKCRKLLGWRCVTSMYRTDQIIVNKSDALILFISLYDLVNNTDHPDFSGDKRTINQITGSTALYIIKESADWVLLYGTDFQYNNDKTTFSGAIQTEFKKDCTRFKERISLDLGIPTSEIK